MPRNTRPTDINKLAKAIVEESTSEQPEESAKAKAGRKGGEKGGKARAKKLTAEERSAIAKKAAEVRWHDRDE